MSVLVNKNTKVICQGLYRCAGDVPLGTGHCLRNPDGGRCYPWAKVEQSILNLPVFDTVMDRPKRKQDAMHL
jgi:succinyl-CoA synthetase alpha subunit